jgi:hypothetical protein
MDAFIIVLVLINPDGHQDAARQRRFSAAIRLTVTEVSIKSFISMPGIGKCDYWQNGQAVRQ